MGRRSQRSVGILGGLAGGAVGVWLGTPVIAFALAQVFGIGAWLFVRYRSWIPETDDWQTRRWNGLLTLVTVAGVMTAVNNVTGTTLRAGIALALLVMGVGYTSFLVGVVMTREAAPDSAENAPKTEPVD